MKLIRFRRPGEMQVAFGAVLGTGLGERAVAFAELAAPGSVDARQLDSIDTYLAGLPDSFALARRLLEEASPGAGMPLTDVELLAPLERPALLADFAVAPAHLRNSARTLMHHEMPALLAPLAARIAANRYAGPLAVKDLKFYFGSSQPFVGPGGTLGWPGYSRHVDPEAELAVVCGAVPAGADPTLLRAAIAGYTIFSDVSARDVQFPEMKTGTLGFMRTKHFDHSNGLGPWLVTPDELGEPLGIKVEVDIGGRLHWQGSTADYAHGADTVLGVLSGICSLPAGSVVGLGTVPGCCGLDTDQWPLPGETVTTGFSGLGTLVQTLGLPATPTRPGRWPRRDWPQGM